MTDRMAALLEGLAARDQTYMMLFVMAALTTLCWLVFAWGGKRFPWMRRVSGFMCIWFLPIVNLIAIGGLIILSIIS